MSSSTVVFKDNSQAWLRVQEQNLRNGLDAMADAIMKNAMVIAPKKFGTLKNSAKVRKINNTTREVVFGGGNVPYAHYQEMGGYGNKIVKNYTTPGTGAHYLEKSGDSVAKQGIGSYI